MARAGKQLVEHGLVVILTAEKDREDIAPLRSIINLNSLFFDAENRGMCFLRPHSHVLNAVTPAPLGDGLDVDAQLSAQRRVRSFRALYESSDGLRGLGPPVKNVPHSAALW